MNKYFLLALGLIVGNTNFVAHGMELSLVDEFREIFAYTDECDPKVDLLLLIKDVNLSTLQTLLERYQENKSTTLRSQCLDQMSPIEEQLSRLAKKRFVEPDTGTTNEEAEDAYRRGDRGHYEFTDAVLGPYAERMLHALQQLHKKIQREGKALSLRANGLDKFRRQ